MTTAALGFGIVCAAIVAFVCRLELRQRKLERQYQVLSNAVQADDRGQGGPRLERAA